MNFTISKPEDCGDCIFFFGSCDGEPFNVSVFWSERGYFLSGVLQDTGECTETYVDTHYYTRKSSAVRAASSYMQRVFKVRAERKAAGSDMERSMENCIDIHTVTLRENLQSHECLDRRLDNLGYSLQVITLQEYDGIEYETRRQYSKGQNRDLVIWRSEDRTTWHVTLNNRWLASSDKGPFSALLHAEKSLF